MNPHQPISTIAIIGAGPVGLAFAKLGAIQSSLGASIDPDTDFSSPKKCSLEFRYTSNEIASGGSGTYALTQSDPVGSRFHRRIRGMDIIATEQASITMMERM
jgi:hypothetical protein